MNTYKVIYNGNDSRIRKASEVSANTEREAIESVYRHHLEHEYFPQFDGSIKDHEGCIVRKPGRDEIRHDGGYFQIIH